MTEKDRDALLAAAREVWPQVSEDTNLIFTPCKQIQIAGSERVSVRQARRIVEIRQADNTVTGTPVIVETLELQVLASGPIMAYSPTLDILAIYRPLKIEAHDD